MKINFIVPGIGNSGGINVLNQYINMMKNDSTVDVVAYANIKGNNMHRYNLEVLNYIHQIYMTIKTIIFVILNDTEDIHWVWDISGRHIREADATIATTWISAYQVAELPSKCGEKFYFIQDFETWDNEYYGLRSYQLPLKKIVISSWINKKLFNTLGIGPFPIVFNGLDTTKFNNYRKKLNKNLKILMLNHTLKKKGVKNGIKIFNYLHAKYPEFKFKMFGMCSDKGLPDYIEYHQNPTFSELRKLYKTSDIFIYPSLEEGWGLTPLEAMACKCAVVGTNTGFVLDVGKNRINMMVSQPDDVEHMINNIEYLINNRNELRKISENGNRTVQKLNWNHSYNRLLKVVKNYDVENKQNKF